MEMTKFFTYHQNNSGGSFEIDNHVALFVIIEADTWQEADEIAIEKGLYFDGCQKGVDCSCCGDRWYSAEWGGTPTDKPSIYGKDPYNYATDSDRIKWEEHGQPYDHIYYKYGNKKTIIA